MDNTRRTTRSMTKVSSAASGAGAKMKQKDRTVLCVEGHREGLVRALKGVAEIIYYDTQRKVMLEILHGDTDL